MAHRLPSWQGGDENKVTASFNKGVLTIDIPKKAEARTATRKIPVETA